MSSDIALLALGPAPTTSHGPIVTILAVLAILIVAGVVVFTIVKGKSRL